MGKKFLQSVLIPTIIVSSSFATSLTLKGGAYEFLDTHSTELTSKDIDLRSNYYNLTIESNFGVYDFKRTLANYKYQNYESFNVKTSTFFFNYLGPYGLIFAPTYDKKNYSEQSRKYEEQTLSMWLGLIGYSEKSDINNNIENKSSRYGLFMSHFAEEFSNLLHYFYGNIDIAKKYSTGSIKTGCKSYLYYITGSISCTESNGLNLYGYYGLSYDYYGIDSTHPVYGNGQGTGFKYGASTVIEASYIFLKYFSFGLSAYATYYQGQEKITYSSKNDNTLTDDLSETRYSVDAFIRGSF